MSVLPASDAPIRTAILHEAAEWLVRLHDEDTADADRQAWRQWLARSDEHARAWQRAERLTALVGDVPGSIGAAPLRRMSGDGRRAALRALVGLMAGTPLAWLAWQRQPWQYAVTDHASGIGQQRELHLDDGTRLHLNTDTRVDLRYDASERRLALLRGEVLVQTAPDPQLPARPFVLETRHGRLQALGTRFAVRLFDTHSRVAVEQGTVQVWPAANPASHIVEVGHQLVFDRHHATDPVALRRDALDWVRGILHAEAMPLGEVVAELARYRPGVVRCDPAVAAIPVSGVFQLADTDTALRLLADTFPVQVRRRSGYWIVVGPR